MWEMFPVALLPLMEVPCMSCTDGSVPSPTPRVGGRFPVPLGGSAVVSLGPSLFL